MSLYNIRILESSYATNLHQCSLSIAEKAVQLFGWPQESYIYSSNPFSFICIHICWSIDITLNRIRVLTKYSHAHAQEGMRIERRMCLCIHFVFVCQLIYVRFMRRSAASNITEMCARMHAKTRHEYCVANMTRRKGQRLTRTNKRTCIFVYFSSSLKIGTNNMDHT